MKIAILLSFASSVWAQMIPFPGPTNRALGNIYTYYQTLTIDHTKCGTTDSANFTMLVAIGSSVDIKVVGSGGFVQHTTTVGGLTVPADLIFTSDLALTNKLTWEIEFYGGSTGTLTAHVLIPNVSHTVDTVIYMGYDAPSITTFQGGSAGSAWHSSYSDVFHFGDGSTLTTADSTANGNNGIGSGLTAAGGSFSGAVFYATSGTRNMTFNVPSSASETISVFAKLASNGTFYQGIYQGASPNLSLLIIGNTGSTIYYCGSSGSVHNVSLPGSGFTDGLWHQLVLVTTATSDAVYFDGSSLASVGSLTNPTYSSGTANLGAGASGVNYFSGYVDEARVSTTVRAAAWIVAEFNNLSSPGSFYSFGARTHT